MFPWITHQDSRERNRYVEMGSSERLAGIVSLVDQIPQELLVLDTEDHLALTCALAAVRHQLSLWQSGVAQAYVLSALRGFEPRTPVVVIRDCLAKCPDESASASSHELAFIDDSELRTSIRLDIGESERNLAAGSWKAATVLAGSAIEALLLWAILQSEAGGAGSVASAVEDCCAKKALQKPPRDPDPNTWDLYEYAPVAEELEWIERETAIQIGQARGFRNLIHPGRARRLGQQCDRGTAFAAAAALHFVARDLIPQ
jgi:hypothetical protein